MAGKARPPDPADVELMRELGQRLAARRKALGLRQGDVAKRAGLTQGTISALEHGQKPYVALIVVYRIASALSLPLYRVLPPPRGKDRDWAQAHLTRSRPGMKLADVEDGSLEAMDAEGE